MEHSERLDWHDGQPVSRRFGDVYFSRAGAVQETAHVFLQGNRLPERFAAMPAAGRFVVGETGFGTGLNFLCTWRLFERAAPANAQLDFVSTERYPLPAEDIIAALTPWPELEPWRARLLAQYAALAPGWHRFDFAPHRVRLTLLVGDARDTLPALHGLVDAWFLDGFSPARNPQLWEPQLLRTIGRLSAAGASVTTYSCAGAVRRGLGDAGFEVRKCAGFGSKREMLAGDYRGPAPTRARRAPGHVAVVGAGLAGCAVASSLARRGWEAVVIERRDGIAAEASGNPQGMLYARLSGQDGPLSQLVGTGYQHSLRLLRRLLPCDGMAWSDAPLLQLAFEAHEQRRHDALERLAWPRALLHGVDQTEAAAVAGVALPFGGVVFPGGGWVHPPALCAAMLATPGIDMRAGARVAALRESGGSWEVRDDHRLLLRADAVVLANAGHACELTQSAHLPLHWNRGQVSLVPASAGLALRAVVCAQRYIAPARDGVHSVGATFERSADSAVRAGDNAENLAALRAFAPALHEALGGDRLDPAALAARAGLRCVSPDYLPLAGALAEPQGTPLPGLYASVAHGSRGLITAPLCGELLADLIDGTPALLPAQLVRALDPCRFLPQPPVPSP